MTPNQSAVFRVIADCASIGEVLPTGPVIAERSGLLVTSVSSALYQLVDQGVIDIENVGHGKRVVTILATGAETGRPQGSIRPTDTPSDSYVAILPPPRDPCWHCGVRGDIGCAHMRWAA